MILLVNCGSHAKHGPLKPVQLLNLFLGGRRRRRKISSRCGILPSRYPTGSRSFFIITRSKGTLGAIVASLAMENLQFLGLVRSEVTSVDSIKLGENKFHHISSIERSFLLQHSMIHLAMNKIHHLYIIPFTLRAIKKGMMGVIHK